MAVPPGEAARINGNAGPASAGVTRLQHRPGGAQPLRLATGGLAGCVTPFCRREIRYEPDLLLIGLAVLWEKNRSGKKA